MNYAGFWRRFAAVFIDGILIEIVAGLLLGIYSGITGVSYNHNVITSNSVQLVLTILYTVVYQSRAGQTLGKKALGIKVVDAQGKTPSMITFFLREIVGKFISTLMLFIGYLWMLWDPNKQTIHDKIAGTYVVRVNTAPVSVVPPVPVAPTAQTVPTVPFVPSAQTNQTTPVQ